MGKVSTYEEKYLLVQPIDLKANPQPDFNLGNKSRSDLWHYSVRTEETTAAVSSFTIYKNKWWILTLPIHPPEDSPSKHYIWSFTEKNFLAELFSSSMIIYQTL